MNEIQNSLFEAIKMFADNSVQNSNATKTIKAEITEIVNPTTGVYKAKYLNDNITVHTDSNLQYSVGDLVYVLIPDGDFSKNKIIIGSAAADKGSSTEVGDTLSYYEISDNLLFEDKNFKTEYELCSYQPKEITVQADFIKSTLKEYMALSREICFSFEVKTKFPEEQLSGDKRGRFGAALTIPLELTSPGYTETQNVDFNLVLDTYNMIGNVYKLEIPTLQTIRSMIGEEYELSNDTDKHIELKFFCSDFPKTANGKPADIFFSNVKIAVVKSYTKEDLQGLSLMLQSTDGRIFRPNALAMKTISPIVRKDGKKIDLKFCNGIYWFIEDASITLGNSEYDANAGAGWKLLNKTNKLNEIISQNTLNVERDDDIKYTNYKCVVLYDKTILSEEIQIVNLYANRELKLVSVSGQTKVTKDNSYFDLKVMCQKVGTENINIFSFNWTHGNKPFAFDLVDTKEENGYFIQIIRVSKIILLEQNTFKCTVFKENKNLGTVSILITTTEAMDIRVHILNGDRIYKYDGDGNAPSSPNYVGPTSSRITHFKPLKYQMFDKDGKEFEEAEYQACKYLWKIPVNSLLKLKMTEMPPMDTNEEYYLISGIGNEFEIPYTLASKYIASKTDGMIYLQVEYANKIYMDETSIQLLKDGASGTNGTEYAVILKYDNYAYGEVDSNNTDHNLRLYYAKNTNKWYYYNYTSKQMTEVSNIAPIIKPAIYKDGEENNISEASVSYSWVDAKVTKPCLYLNTAAADVLITPTGTGNLTLDTINYSNIHILKAEVRIDGTVLYAFYPIEITYDNTYKQGFVGITEGYGDVQFTSQGGSPAYDSTNSFAYVNNYYTSGTVEWNYSSAFKESTNEELDALHKECRVAIKQWLGDSVNYIKVAYGNTITVRPIVFRYNRYGAAWLNGWDGTKLEIDKNGTYIAAPVIGAGKKETDNSFTGMIMGQIVESGGVTKIGLTGRSKGVESFFLDAYTGKATFGRPDTGQIIIDPDNSNQAVIYGGKYVKGTSGMMINLSKPSIEWGNGNFYITDNGSFGFGGDRIKFDASKNNLTLSGVNINWSTTTNPEIVNVKGLTEDLAFKSASIVANSNAIATEVRERTAQGDTLQSNITQTAKDITSTVSATYETKTDAVTTKKNLEAQITQTATDITTKVTNVETNLSKNYYNKTTTDSQISQSATGILSTVSQTYETKTNASTQYSAINQTMNNINIEVGKKIGASEVVSSINVSQDKITLGTGRLEINATNFKLTADGTVTATNGNFSGTLTAGAGSKIGPWDIASNYIGTLGAANVTVFMSQGGQDAYVNQAAKNLDCCFYAKGNFAIDTSGTLYASDAKIGGTLTAGVGSRIGNWQVTPNFMFGTAYWSTINNISGFYGIALDGKKENYQNNNYVFAIGRFTETSSDTAALDGGWGNCNLRVNANGDVIAKSLTIEGGSITLGTGFSVNSNGYLKATYGTIGGFYIGTSSLSGTSSATYQEPVMVLYPNGYTLGDYIYYIIIKDYRGAPIAGLSQSGWRTGLS